jgi:hypothetical protein
MHIHSLYIVCRPLLIDGYMDVINHGLKLVTAVHYVLCVELCMCVLVKRRMCVVLK